MIRTVTLSSGFDEVFTVDRLVFGSVTAVLKRQVWASGKGVNAARAAAALGADVVVYALVGAQDRREFEAHLAMENLNCRLSEVPGGTRHNLTLVAADSPPAAHFRGDSFSLSDDRPVRMLFERLLAEVRPGDIVSVHGATPAGLAESTWTSLGVEAKKRGARIIADVYGEPLVELLERCELEACKPNEDEARVLPVSGRFGPAAALRYLEARGVGLATVSLGARGLAFLQEDRVWLARCPVNNPRILVGAGDACTGGLAVALGSGVSKFDAVRASVAAAAAHVEGSGPGELAARVRTLLPTVQMEPAGSPDDRT